MSFLGNARVKGKRERILKVVKKKEKRRGLRVQAEGGGGHCYFPMVKIAIF